MSGTKPDSHGCDAPRMNATPLSATTPHRRNMVSRKRTFNEDAETRRAVIRGFNIVTADYFRDLSDRLTPAAVIPMHTPEEAIEELEFVTRQLGSKVGMFGSGIKRTLPAAQGVDPAVARFAAH